MELARAETQNKVQLGMTPQRRGQFRCGAAAFRAPRKVGGIRPSPQVPDWERNRLNNVSIVFVKLIEVIHNFFLFFSFRGDGTHSFQPFRSRWWYMPSRTWVNGQIVWLQIMKGASRAKQVRSGNVLNGTVWGLLTWDELVEVLSSVSVFSQMFDQCKNIVQPMK